MSKTLRRYAVPAAAFILSGGNPFITAAASGVNNYVDTRNVGSALASAGGSYLGANIGGALAGNVGGTVGNAVNSALGPEIGSVAGQALGSNIIGANLGATLGSFAGGHVGGDLASSLVPQKTKNPTGESAGPAPFKPTRAGALNNAPLNLGGLTDIQQGTNLASQGVYGGGTGPEEQNYFLNLINRRLVDDSGNVDSDFGDINPTENSYLAQLGLGNKKTPNDLLQAISTWRA